MKPLFLSAFACIGLLGVAGLAEAHEDGGAAVRNPDVVQSAKLFAIANPGEQVVINVAINSSNEQSVSIYDHVSGTRIHYFNNKYGKAPAPTGTWTSPKNETAEPVVYVVEPHHTLNGGPGNWVFSWTQIFTASDNSSYIGVEEGDDKDFNDVILKIGTQVAP